MTIRKRRVRDYRCWYCGKTLEINVPPYQRGHWKQCNCEKEGKPGGMPFPRGLTADELERIIAERGPIDDDYAIQPSDIPGIREAMEEIGWDKKLKECKKS
jgi:hypothetical protein